MSLGQGLIRVRSNAQIDADAAAKEKAYEGAQSAQTILGLSAYLERCWSEAYLAKENGIRSRLDEAMFARQGKYTPDKLQQIRATGQSETYVRVTATKCRVASGWLKDIYLGDSEKPWTLEPTPVPDLPLKVEELADIMIGQQIDEELAMGLLPDPLQVALRFGELKDKLTSLVEEEAKARADRAAEVIDDQLTQGGFSSEFAKFIDDFVLFPAAILKGPIVRKRKTRSYKAVDGAAQKKLVIEEDFVYDVQRVSPYDFYPSPNAESVQDGYCFEHMRINPSSLEAYKGVPGYDTSAIDKVLTSPDGYRNWTFDTTNQQKAEAEGRSTALSSTAEGLIDILEFHGWVSGRMLREWGAAWVEDDAKQYNVCVWKCRDLILKAQLNYNPLGLRPYGKASFEEIPGAFWGNGLADLVEDPQTVCNAAIRALTGNMAMASGPQVMVDTAFMAPGERLTTLTPWKVWKMKSEGLQGTQKLMDFFQPQSNAQELLAVFNQFYNLADDVASLPRYMGGASTTASRTATGLSMLMDAGGKALKQAAMNVDQAISVVIHGFYDLNLMVDAEGVTFNGDSKVVVRGATRLMQKAQMAQRRNEMLMTTANPFDMQIMGLDGRAYLLREQARSLDMNPDKIVPTLTDMRKAAAMQAMQSMPAQGSQPAPAGGQTLADGAPVADAFGE